MKYAIMIIDLQKEYYNDETKKSMDNACDYINAILPYFREGDHPVIWVQDKDEEDGVVPGYPGFDLLDGLTPNEGEYRIIKEYGNSFNKTDCEKILKDAEVDIVVITGFCAEYCVTSTYRGAQDKDLTPVILKNAIASFSDTNKGFVEDIHDTITLPILRKLLLEK